ncbi:molybdate ABC transporter substrate-binding protein [Colwellia sp. 6_MG-2023]|uniref:molybdate ABC transporter substrate-binding protein n=1 Tax=Colwellia sp. 6_MG-2023 TaxID=3062676 RepID=UPI0026E2F604|nr:molybdate ABC transporter substrate-binding protein [Colwellia sp. 6_MG-2023]MDO6486884.1 molybdate ABC transporter substrate-binding protein [Colwellia sp. 6_MG-2023]
MKLYSFTQSLTNKIVLVILSISIILSNQALSANKAEQTNTNNHPLRIAVASNFTTPLKELLIDFHQQTGIKTQIISGATGAMFIQIQHGAPFDIFLAADSIRPAKLEQQNLIIAKSRKTYALGQLALFSMNSTASLEYLQYLSQKENQRFAIANPDTAPYGKAAKETLAHLGLWQPYQNKLVVGININQTFAQIRTQAVSNGLIANSQLVLNNLAGAVIPSDYHQPIEQQLVILKNSKNVDNAKKLSEYLLSPSVQKKIVNFGYAAIEQP